MGSFLGDFGNPHQVPLFRWRRSYRAEAYGSGLLLVLHHCHFKCVPWGKPAIAVCLVDLLLVWEARSSLLLTSPVTSAKSPYLSVTQLPLL